MDARLKETSFETLPDEMVLKVLQNLDLIDLMKLIIAFPNTRLGSVLCFDHILINKLPPIHIYDIHRTADGYHRNNLLMKWVNMSSVKNKCMYFDNFYEKYDNYKLTIGEEFASFNAVFNKDGRLEGNILRTLDGYIYIRVRSINEGLIEFKCARHHKGCQVKILTNYTYYEKYYLQVFWQASTHSHPPSIESIKRERELLSVAEIWDSFFPLYRSV